MCGEEQPSEENFLIYPRRGRVGEKKVNIFLAGAGLVSPKHTNSCQNVQIPCQYEPIPRHGEKRVKISSPGQGWREKIWIFNPQNSCPAPPRNAIHRKMRSRQKKQGCVTFCLGSTREVLTRLNLKK